MVSDVLNIAQNKLTNLYRCKTMPDMTTVIYELEIESKLDI